MAKVIPVSEFRQLDIYYGYAVQDIEIPNSEYRSGIAFGLYNSSGYGGLGYIDAYSANAPGFSRQGTNGKIKVAADYFFISILH